MSSEYEGYDEWVRSALRTASMQAAAEDMYVVIKRLMWIAERERAANETVERL